jgi:hypothetical protein
MLWWMLLEIAITVTRNLKMQRTMPCMGSTQIKAVSAIAEVPAFGTMFFIAQEAGWFSLEQVIDGIF